MAILRECGSPRYFAAYFLAISSLAGPPLASPDSASVGHPDAQYMLLNDRSLGRFVTFDVRNASHEFMHHIQSGVAAS